MRCAAHIGRVVLIYLLLGFVATWAVAWGLALLPAGLHSDVARHSRIDGRGVENGIDADTMTGVGSIRNSYDTWSQFEGVLRDQDSAFMQSLVPSFTSTPGWNLSLALDATRYRNWGRAQRAIAEGPDSEWASGVDDARGLPFVALWCSWPRTPGTAHRQNVTGSGLVGGIKLSSAPRTMGYMGLRALPYMPIWSGLALNTAFYALLFFAVVRIGRAFKRSRRFGRGLCPKCKYDRVFDYQLPCPECGHQGKVRPAGAVA